ncbi:MAG: hypothetical protein LHW64_10205 [Candidatus Cloacimonetes bacterium]|nr:hypothetical protein [Candidatus Cloacimonadota bacterium]MDY0230481.1 hypothetical protein [Candidatus Cloacimonadaceae bacterium]
MPNNPKVILIISSGHSGSTLLDLLFGTIPGVVSTGELIWLPWQVWRDGKLCTATPKQDICTCLETFRQCPVWSKILQSISNQFGNDISKDPLSFNISFLRHQKYSDGISYKSRILRKIMRSAIVYDLTWLSDLIIGSQREIIQNTCMLYDHIAGTLETPYMVDSSKDILRAYAIWKERPDDTMVVLLHKDAKSYAASGKHWKAPASIQKRLQKWLDAYRKTYIPVLKKMAGCRILSVKYDELAMAPEQVRKELATFIGILPDSLPKWGGISPQNMHIVAGNPMRFKETIHIKYDDRWRTELSSKELDMAVEYEAKMQDLINTLPDHWDHAVDKN